jgi:hypothetical protein
VNDPLTLVVPEQRGAELFHDML